MYNLTVANDHTYAVGDGQAVVHNTCGGPGYWTLSSKEAYGGWSDVSVRYQEQITGQMQGLVYRVDTGPGKWVDFEGYDDARHVFLDAKAKYGQFFQPDGSAMPWFRGGNLVKEANNQLAAVSGYRIEWHVMQEGAANGIRRILQEARVTGIDVIHTPLLALP